MSPRPHVRCVALLFALGACHKSVVPTDGGVQDQSQLLDVLRDGVIAACVPPTTYGFGEITMNSATVMAKIVDETGAAVGAQPVSICGVDICGDVSMTAADGSASIMSDLTEKAPSFLFGDAMSYAKFAIPLTQASTDFTMGGHVIATGKLAGKPGALLMPGTTAVAGDVTITLPVDDTVSIDLVTYQTPDSQLLRTVDIPLTNTAPLFASTGATGFALLYGVSPAETTFCPPVQVSVALPHTMTMPNDLGWAPGSQVEFWVTTTDQGQVFAPFGGWAKISDGLVASDGMSVATLPSQGFNFLESFAIRSVQ
jgi:hypothetical protein